MRRIPAEKVGDPHSGSGEEGESESDYESLPELQFSWRCLQTGQRLVPSGLANYGNMCFLNSVSSSPGMTVTNRIGCGRQILQSLIHCPPFSNTFARLHDRLAFLSHRRAPFLRAIDDLIAAHEIAPRNESLSAGDRSCRTLVPDLLYECFREFSQSKRLFHGAQEDAQEFLTFLIDQLHEELLKSASLSLFMCVDLWLGVDRKLLNWRFDESSGEARSHGIGDARGGEWLEVGKRGVTLTRTMEHHHSPISFLFFGQYRSVVRRARGKDSVTMEPFHCVSLEINDSSIASLADAFVHMSRPEPIDGEAITKTVTIGTAPPILIIHLKRFYYHAVYGVEKLGKFIQYPEYLELGGAPRGGAKSDDSYRLFAVIYHHGRTADGGHYTCHVRDLSHPGGAGGELLPWMYFDDASMTEQSLGTVLADKGSAQSAYLLFYIRHGPVG